MRYAVIAMLIVTMFLTIGCGSSSKDEPASKPTEPSKVIQAPQTKVVVKTVENDQARLDAIMREISALNTEREKILAETEAKFRDAERKISEIRESMDQREENLETMEKKLERINAALKTKRPPTVSK